MFNHIDTFVISKYIKENNINLSSIRDPKVLEKKLLDIRKKISINVEDVIEFNKKEETLGYGSYNFWVNDVDTNTSIEDVVSYSIDDEINKATRFLKNKTNILISCGAGMSISSNLPCFFGENGVWKKAYDMNRLYSIYDTTNPGETYFKLFEFIKKYNHFVFTSNIDNLFIKAGFDEKKLCECHGNYSQKQCTAECKLVFKGDKCPACGSNSLENVLKYTDTKNFCLERLNTQEENLKKFLENKDICIIELGCGINTPTIRDYNEILVETRDDINLIRVNPTHWYVPEQLQNKSCMLRLDVESFLNLKFN
jgi:NAD-dependent SIR2 family protein deacetylase